jgi:hypothetical protein
MRLLKKVFDSLNKLDLHNDTKMAYASKLFKFFGFLLIFIFILVYSDDGERVKFFNDCNLEGPVEIWLSRLLDFHCETIRNWLRVAVTAYEV